MSFIIATNPSENHTPLGQVTILTNDEIALLVTKAHTAFQMRGKISLDQRLSYLKTVLHTFETHREALAHMTALEMGMPIKQAREDISMGLDYFTWYLDNAARYLSPEITYEDAEQIHKALYEPIGVAAVIVPRNFPFSNFIWQVGQNLVVGNTVVFKHAKETQLCAQFIDDCFKEATIPSGVFSVVYGTSEQGEYLLSQPLDLLCFTGSTIVGNRLYQLAAQKFIPAIMELGGSAPGIIFQDADLDKAVETIYYRRFSNCGQICDGLKRLIVHESVFETVVTKLHALLQTQKIGNAIDESTDIGPLVSEKQLTTLEAQVQDAVDKGATLVCGGKRPVGMQGSYYEPTLLTGVTPTMHVWHEEVFGPVLPVVSFTTYEEAVALANDTIYGLGGYVFTQDAELFEKTARDFQTGMVQMNQYSYVKPCNPFGGYKASGLGRQHGKYGFYELCQKKVITLQK